MAPFQKGKHMRRYYFDCVESGMATPDRVGALCACEREAHELARQRISGAVRRAARQGGTAGNCFVTIRLASGERLAFVSADASIAA
jgi:hypothetical protein